VFCVGLTTIEYRMGPGMNLSTHAGPSLLSIFAGRIAPAPGAAGEFDNAVLK